MAMAFEDSMGLGFDGLRWSADVCFMYMLLCLDWILTSLAIVEAELRL